MRGSFPFAPPTGQTNDRHHPKIHDDGTILPFDNGDRNGGRDTQVPPLESS
ncbi:MAG: hypothetical protein JXP73_06545 [Deltaproteobacteria bacterium]|jgi:hypothetical protein|nr:hypothetical protein [Deltaproteobacteria bacterium]